MNTLSNVIYLSDVVGGAKAALMTSGQIVIAASLCAVALRVIVVMAPAPESGDARQNPMTAFRGCARPLRWLWLAAALIVASILMPGANTLRLIAASEIAAASANTPEAAEIYRIIRAAILAATVAAAE